MFPLPWLSVLEVIGSALAAIIPMLRSSPSRKDRELRREELKGILERYNIHQNAHILLDELEEFRERLSP